MMDFVRSLPLVPAILFLYVVVLLRAGGTYALGRAARSAADRGAVGGWLASPRVAKATRVVNTWGAPVVAFSFLTVGFQTAVNAAAGLTGMPLKRYLPALAIGGLAWATIYATVGLAAIGLWFQLFLRSPWAAVAALALVVALVIVIVVTRRRRGRSLVPDVPGAETTIPGETR